MSLHWSCHKQYGFFRALLMWWWRTASFDHFSQFAGSHSIVVTDARVREEEQQRQELGAEVTNWWWRSSLTFSVNWLAWYTWEHGLMATWRIRGCKEFYCQLFYSIWSRRPVTPVKIQRYVMAALGMAAWLLYALEHDLTRFITTEGGSMYLPQLSVVLV